MGEKVYAQEICNFVGNLLWVTVSTEEHKNELTALIESNGLPADGVKIEVTDILFENPL